MRQQYISNGGREAAMLAQIADVESAIMELDRLNHSVVNIREHRGLFLLATEAEYLVELGYEQFLCIIKYQIQFMRT